MALEPDVSGPEVITHHKHITRIVVCYNFGCAGPSPSTSSTSTGPMSAKRVHQRSSPLSASDTEDNFTGSKRSKDVDDMMEKLRAICDDPEHANLFKELEKFVDDKKKEKEGELEKKKTSNDGKPQDVTNDTNDNFESVKEDTVNKDDVMVIEDSGDKTCQAEKEKAEDGACASNAQAQVDAVENADANTPWLRKLQPITGDVEQASPCIRTVKDTTSHSAGPSTSSTVQQSGNETMQESTTSFPENQKLHIPILLEAQQSCSECRNNNDLSSFCNSCGIREHIFFGEDCVEKFVSYLVLPRRNFSKIIVLAHNFSKFDGSWILRHMSVDRKWSPDVILNGKKIICMTYDIIKFVDSLCFIPMALRKIPSVFGFENVVKKGFAPHFFSKRKNLNYVGAYPAPEFYGTEHMSSKEKKEFFEWYDSVKTSVFDYKSTLITYCRSDVTILRRGVEEYIDLFVDVASVNPMLETCTLPAACLLAFRRNFLKPDSLSLIPYGNYRLGDIQSFSAIMWLVYESRDSGVYIHHAGNGREQMVHGRKVDGLAQLDEKTTCVYQFHGCLFHGCLDCFKDRDATPGPLKNTIGERYQDTLSFTNFLVSKGCLVKEMWECNFRKFLSRNKEVKQFLESQAVYFNAPIIPRESLYGGRTMAVKLYHDCKPGEKIRYLDFCSLYPYCLKYKPFIVGHPELYQGDDCPPISELFGIVKIKFLPPRNLFFPVLPVKFDNKLMFPLCRSCMEERRDDFCNHENVEDRCFTGTFVTEEVKLAVEHGYIILHMYEAWHYQKSQYDTNTKQGGLFTDYIDTFFKLKCESSGFPPHVQTESEKLDYIKMYKEVEGIDLKMENIKYNSGRRALTKLLVTTLWGKLSQRSDLNQFVIVQDPNEMEALLDDKSIEVKGVTPVENDTMYVTYKPNVETLVNAPNTNVVLAAFTTCYGRMHLYKVLHELQQRVLYTDTDSVLFVSTSGSKDPEEGIHLGQLTDEITPVFGENSFIKTFVAGGAKNYCYLVQCADGSLKSVCKARGLTINSETEKILNFDTLCNMVLNNSGPTLVHYPHNLKRTKKFEILTAPMSKTYQMVNTKRWRAPDTFQTLPYGFKL
ncbi:UNVERIFIED_CONTAM: hypothetical protein B566_EDAN018504 [Ephemera danica]|nr:hypothetical protein B566_EDAN018504 [Ephemera danica]